MVLKSKHVFNEFNISDALAFFDQHNLDFDTFDGVVSFKDEDTTVNGKNLSVTFRNVTTSYSAYRKSNNPLAPELNDQHTILYFNFNSSKSRQNNIKNIPQGLTIESWFDVLFEGAVLLAKATKRQRIVVSSGRTDSKMIKSKGFQRENSRYYNFYLNI